MGTSTDTGIAPEATGGRKQKSILLVEDDVELCSLMADFFAQHGFRVEPAYNDRHGLARALDGAFDLVILDIMLPALDGFEVLRQLRKRSSIPVIMLTARIARQDRITGLDAGADDYLPKPFEAEELLARVRAVLRRTGSGAAKQEVVEACGLTLDSKAREIRSSTGALEITALEFEILELLMRSAGRVVSRDELATVLYQRQATPWERSLDVHISHLRRKLELAGQSPIRTIRGIGYLFHP